MNGTYCLLIVWVLVVLICLEINPHVHQKGGVHLNDRVDSR